MLTRSDGGLAFEIECRRAKHLVRLVLDQGNDHAVKIEEEHDKVEPELDERFLDGELASMPLVT